MSRTTTLRCELFGFVAAGFATSKKIAGVTVHRIGHTEAAYVIDANGFERALFLWPYRAQDVVETLRGLARAS